MNTKHYRWALKTLMMVGALVAANAGIARAADQNKCLGKPYYLCIADYENANKIPGIFKNIQNANPDWAVFNWASQADVFANYCPTKDAHVYTYANYQGRFHTISPNERLTLGSGYNFGRSNDWGNVRSRRSCL